MTDIERMILERGRDLIRAAKRYAPGVAERINNAVFEMCMKDPHTKKQLFRFIDVLPNLKTDALMTQHLQEYLWNEKIQVPLSGLAKLASWLTPNPTARVVRMASGAMAKSFIPGASVEKAYKAIIQSGHKFTIDILGEKTTSETDAGTYMDAYLHALDYLSSEYGEGAVDEHGNPQINLSIKVSALYSRFDPLNTENSSSHVRNRLREIFRKAMEVGAAINIDVEHRQYKDLTYDIFKGLLEEDEFRTYGYAGIVVQAYLKDSETTLMNLINWTKRQKRSISIRLVKGAYWDHEVMLAQQNHWDIPVFTEKWETDANFEELTRILLKNAKYTHAAIATHNIRSLVHALVLKDKLGVDDAHFELQFLCGMANEIKKALIEQKVPFRVYTPVGELIPGMGYFVRRLLENSSNESFIRAFDTTADPAELLRMPEGNIKAQKGESVVEKNLGYMGQGKSPEEADTLFENFISCDFSTAVNRSRMSAALDDLEVMDSGLYINGEWIETTKRIESTNPSNRSEVLGKVGKAEKREVLHALESARKAYDSWKRVSARERAGYLEKAAVLMGERVYDLSALMVKEAGKNWREAYVDTAEAIDFLNFYAAEMKKLGDPVKTQELLGEDNFLSYRPKGVVAVISPWNFPLAILTGMTSAAIVTGNTTVIKPASESPLIAAELVQIFAEVGLPKGVLNYVPGSGAEVGNLLVESPLVDMIAFTGSRKVGLSIYEKMSRVKPGQKNLKTAIVELGGKNGLIVDSTADIDEAIPALLYSAFGYQGQKCSACSRVIVLNRIYDAFVAKLLESTRSLIQGDTSIPGVDVGPVISKRAYDTILGYIEKGKADGGKVLYEGSHQDTPGNYLAPTIIEVESENILAKEEIFGPVLSVLRVNDFSSAIAVLNSTDYALTGGLFSRTPSHIKQFIAEAGVGNRYINRGITGAVVERQPFGGFKMSGAGSKAGSTDYLKAFMYPITTTENTGRKGHIPGLDEFAR
ncbi:hypothetical protein BVY04_02315 [bacterium M21]|nr:hypothetical protein BVY04_02270 [bacterium M21]OVE81857.1 hypothetical protein BVY04_02315 [bacterium M21]